ncbi:probable U3 small nucleolar RNA-associated protein 7 [Tanacetum coccineum]
MNSSMSSFVVSSTVASSSVASLYHLSNAFDGPLLDIILSELLLYSKMVLSKELPAIYIISTCIIQQHPRDTVPIEDLPNADNKAKLCENREENKLKYSVSKLWKDWKHSDEKVTWHKVKETVRDVVFLHNELFFDAAPKKYMYIYNQSRAELHCLKNPPRHQARRRLKAIELTEFFDEDVKKASS